MRRFYALSLQPDLFVSVVKEWGRIGQPGTVRHNKRVGSEGDAEDLRPA
jgi:predicted DNA-binding WGR domain protein